MNRLLIACFLLCGLPMAGTVHAQTTGAAPTAAKPMAAATAVGDTSQLNQYVGTYTVAIGDVKQIIVTVEGGKLMGEAVGLGQSNLLPNPDTRDAFTVPDPNGSSDTYATVQFGRDTAGKVKKVLLIVQGQNIEGIRAN